MKLKNINMSLLLIILSAIISFDPVATLSSHQMADDQEVELELTVILIDSNFTVEGTSCSPHGTTGILVVDIAPEGGSNRGYRISEWRLVPSRDIDGVVVDGCAGSTTITVPIASSYEVQVSSSGVHIITYDQVSHENRLLLIWNAQGISTGQAENPSSIVAAPTPTPIPDPAFLLRDTGSEYVVESIFFGPHNEYISVYSYKFTNVSLMVQTFERLCLLAETDFESAPYSSPVSIGRPGELVCAFGDSGDAKAVVGCSGSLFAVRTDMDLGKLPEVLTAWCERADLFPDELVPALPDLPTGWNSPGTPTIYEGQID